MADTLQQREAAYRQQNLRKFVFLLDLELALTIILYTMEHETQTYSIQEISQKTGLSAYTLRFYEKAGIIQEVARKDNGHRFYSEHDAGWIDFITCLKSTGMSIDEIRQFADLVWEGDHTIDQRMEILTRHREAVLQRMTELQQMLDRVNGKISTYEKLKKNMHRKTSEGEYDEV